MTPVFGGKKMKKYRNYSAEYKKVDLDDRNERAATTEAADDNRSKEIVEKMHNLTAVDATVTVLSNLRESPSLDSNILTVIEEGTKIKIFDSHGDFYKAELGNLKGYIKKDLVKR